MAATEMSVFTLQRRHGESLTFAGEVWAEPLGRGVVEETLGVSEAHGEVARVAGVLQHRLQGELLSLTGAVVGSVLHSGGRGTVH